MRIIMSLNLRIKDMNDESKNSSKGPNFSTANSFQLLDEEAVEYFEIILFDFDLLDCY